MSKSEKPAAKRAPKITREQLEAAAKLRAQGATWNAIREATGTKLGSGTFQTYWAKEGIDALPSHSPEFKAARAARNKPAEPAQAEPQAKPSAGARKPAAASSKPAAKRVVRSKKPAAKKS